MSSRPSAGSVASDGGSCCLSLAAFGSLIFRNNQSKEVPRKSEMAASAIAVEATPLVERPFLSLRKEAGADGKEGVRSRQTVIAKAVSDAKDLENDPMEARRQMILNGMAWLWKKAQAAFWVAAACGMIWWTNFFRVIWEHPDVNKVYFYLALGCLAFVMALLWYLSMWLPMVYGKDHAWEDDHPKIIPVMTVASLCMTFFFFLAFWRVWGFLTLLLEFVLFLGFASSAQFLPGGHLGVICMFVIFFGSWFTSEMIPHKGLAHYTPKGLATFDSPDLIVP